MKYYTLEECMKPPNISEFEKILGEYEEMYGHYKPLFIPEDELTHAMNMKNYILDMEKGEKMPKTKNTEVVVESVESLHTEIPVDCTEYYRPPFVEWAHNNEQGVLVKGKKKGSTNIEIPRLKHRHDLKKYIKTGSPLPYLTMNDVNPNCGQSGIWKVLVDILRETILNPELVIGYLNEIPVYKIPGQELPSKSCENCGFKNTCEFKGECACVFRPQQCIIWGVMENDVFMEIEKTLESKRFTLYDILKKIEEKEIELYKWFAQGKSIADSIKKLATNIATMQRVSLKSYNCYGLPFLQCGMALNTEYNTGGEIEVWLSVGNTTPKVASLREYKKKANLQNKLSAYLKKLEKMQKEGEI